jgi:hypothetical protein
MKLSKWGMIEAWIAQDPRGRHIVFGIGPQGFQVTAIDSRGQHIELIGPSEDPADVSFRAISILG